MSRNFELLSQLDQREELQPPPPGKAAPIPAPRPRPIIPNGVPEEEMKLVQRVFLLPGQDAPKSVVFCGVDGDDGSKALSVRVGEILAARKSGSVCLVDADLQAPWLHRRFGISNEWGVSDAALESGPAWGLANQVGDGNLWVLPAGTRTAERQAVFSPERFGRRIEELREHFSYVLISAPPINACSDAALLGRLADGIILVLRAGSTRRATAVKVKEYLEASGVRLLGAILTERTFPVPEPLYRLL